MTDWISVKEKYPKNCQDVIATDGEDVTFSTYFHNSEDRYDKTTPEHEFIFYGDLGYFRSENWLEITYWMPLPEPPKKDIE